MSLHIIIFFTSILAIIVFIHLVVFVLCTCLLLNAINSLLSLLNVLKWAIVHPRKDLFVTIQVLTNFVFLWMLFSLRISISFLIIFNHLLFLLFFLIFRICHCLLSGSNQIYVWTTSANFTPSLNRFATWGCCTIRIWDFFKAYSSWASSAIY